MKRLRIHSRRRGAAILVAIIMAFLLVAIAGVSLSMVSTNRRITDAHFTYHAIQPLAERGLDQAMKVLNKYIQDNRGANGLKMLKSSDDSKSWTASTEEWKLIETVNAGTTAETRTYLKDFGALDLGDKRIGVLKVKIFQVPTEKTEPDSDPTKPYTPYAVAEVVYSAPNDPSYSYSRQILASFAIVSAEGPGMVSLDLMTFTGGNVFVAAYKSSLGPPSDRSTLVYTGSPPPLDKDHNLLSQVTVATLDATGLDLGQVNIYGFAATTQKAEIGFAKNAHVWDVASIKPYWSAGVDGYNTDGSTNPDGTSNLNTELTLDKSQYPVDNLSSIVDKLNASIGGSRTTLPLKGLTNTIKVDKFGNLTPKVLDGTTEGGVYYLDDSVKLNDAGALQITGKVTLIVGSDAVGTPKTTSPAPSFEVSGKGGILIDQTTVDEDFDPSTPPTPKASLSVYGSGDVTISGNGIMGGTDPLNLLDLGTPGLFHLSGINEKPGAQDITFSGNGAFSGVIYAPNADLQLNGGGSRGTVRGAVVAYTIGANGVINFYYDVNLASTLAPQFRLSSMTELIGTSKITL